MNYEKILKDNEKMIWKMTSYFYGVDKNDLFQAGIVGLLKALRKYEKNSITKFSTYAYDYIWGEMYLLASNKNIKISKDILKLFKKIEETRYILAQKWNKVPNNLEVAEFLGMAIYDVDLACKSAYSILSLDLESDENRNTYEMIADKKDDIDTKIFLEESLSKLNQDEQNIIKFRYFEDLTQTEVARKLNMSQVMVSRYEKRGINKLKNFMTM